MSKQAPPPISTAPNRYIYFISVLFPMAGAKLLLFSILILALPFAAPFPNEAQAFSLCLPAAVGIAAGVIALAYMAAKFLQLPGLEAWTKIEFQELITSILLVVLIAGVAAAAGVFVGVISGRGVATYNSLALEAASSLDTMQGDLQASFAHSVRVLYTLNKAVGFSYSLSMSVFFLSSTSSVAPRSGLGPLAMGMINAMNGIANAQLLIETMKMFLQFFAIAVPKYLLPAAIVLRTFSPTRKIGSTLIAVAIGAWLVYPASLLFTGEIYQQIKTGAPGGFPDLSWNVPDMRSPPESKLLCNPAIQVFAIVGEDKWVYVFCQWMLSNPFTAPAYPFCSVLITLIYLGIVAGTPYYFSAKLRNYVGDHTVNEFFDPLFNHGLPAMTALVVLDLSLAIASMIITISMVRSISAALGGEVQLYGLAKII